MFNYEFMQNAYLSGTIIAIVSGFIGVFVMAKGMAFLTHILSEIGFAGSSFALFMGWSPILGMLGFTLVSAITIGRLGEQENRQESLITGVSSIAIGSGVAFLALSKKNSSSATSILFGSIFSINTADVFQVIGLAIAVLIVGILLYKRLRHFAFDYSTAEYSMKNINIIEIIFLIMVAITVAVSAQIVGSLLIFILMTLPASSAMRLGRTVSQMITLSILFSVVGVWIAITLSYFTDLPTSFYIAMIESAIYFFSLRVK